MKILQDYIVPYVRLDKNQGKWSLGSVHGTAFFINSSGAFLTARHVIENCASDIEKNGGIPALVVRDDTEPSRRFAGKIVSYDFAELPFDVAIGMIQRPTKGYFLFGDSSVRLI